ncbi:MAG: hypothetical protein WA395_07320 [Nitrososphaeraceae archaeon]
MSLDDDPAQNKPIDSTKLIEVELPTYLIGKIEAFSQTEEAKNLV